MDQTGGVHGVRIRNGFVSWRDARTRETSMITVIDIISSVRTQHALLDNNVLIVQNRFQTVAVACYGARRVHLVV